MKKPHKDFLYRAHTQQMFRLIYSHDNETGEYSIRLQNFYDIAWSDDGVIETDTSFARIEAVWVFLIRQGVDVWLKVKRSF